MAKRAIIIEDDKDMNGILKEILINKGFHALNYYDGSSALDEFKKTKFDLAIIDYKLPNLSGIDILKSIRSIDPDIKVLMLSAHGDNKVKDKAREFGVKNFLDKPFDLKELNSLIDENSI